MNTPTRFLIRKDTDVWVAKGIGFPCVLVKHKMLKDLTIPYPVAAAVEGPKVVGLAHERDNLSPSQVMIFEALRAESTMFSKRGGMAGMSFYGILSCGWHIFSTDDEEYPFLVAHRNEVEEIDNDWDVEDLGDMVLVNRKRKSTVRK